MYKRKKKILTNQQPSRHNVEWNNQNVYKMEVNTHVEHYPK